MIQANELRLDNLTQWGVNIVKLKSIHTESVFKDRVTVYVEINERLKFHCLNIEELEPIPLTEEWLMKFGFDLVYEKRYIGIKYKIGDVETDFVLTHPNVLGVFEKCFIWEYSKNKYKKLQYVHQLQNLFFDITDQELTIKEA